MGRLARSKATTRPIRTLAERMVSGHTHANQQLAALAKRLHITAAPPPDQPPPELLTSTGPEFDRQYVGLVIKAHRDMIALFESEANGGGDPRAKRWARGMLPELRHHLREAEAIGHRLGV
ncbi:MAG TPA: DUF4142 domain-containing protein, partial [Stellaceae bacterium]|nr:DUF4142 domain-containing protein [Stellaceae bacterium]